MLAILYLFFLSLAVFCTGSDFTFKNVEFRGYSVYTLIFTKTIKKSDSLTENLPEVLFDHLEFLDQHIPVLRKNSISDIDNLDELTIKNCKLREIQPGAFRKLPFLRRLNLNGNDLEEIKVGVFNNLPLSMLDLSSNKIKSIEASALDNLPNILNVNLADNYITEWNKRWFHNTPLLTRISMQNNSLEKLPSDAFTNINADKNYRSIKLTINLVFSHNRISHIDDGAFKGLNKINNLWLDHNKLTEFKENLLEDVEVQNLRLEGNNIRCLTGDLSKILKAETTHVDDNPFDCECLENIKKWAHDYNKNVEMPMSDLNCSINSLRKRLVQIEKFDWKEESEETTSNPNAKTFT